MRDRNGCDAFDAQLIDAVFGADAGAELDRHVASCERCRVAREAYRRTASVLDAAVGRDARAPRSLARSPWRWLAAASAVTAAAIVLWLLVTRDQERFSIAARPDAVVTMRGEQRARLERGAATFSVGAEEAVVELPAGTVRGRRASFAIDVVLKGDLSVRKQTNSFTLVLTVMSGVAWLELPGESVAVAAPQSIMRTVAAAGAMAFVPSRSPVLSGATLQGTLVDLGGAQLADATVQLMASGGEWLADAETDEDGAFGFTGLAAGNYALRAKSEGDAPLVGEAAVANLAEDETRAVTLSVERRYFISGTLVQRMSGDPVARMPIMLYRSRGYRSNDDICIALGETDANGHFRSAMAVHDGNAALTIVQGTSGLITDWSSGGLVLQQLRIGAEPVTDLTLVFPWTGVVEGEVIDAAGHPVAGATVVALNPNRSYFGGLGRDTQQATTSDDGAFRIERLPTECALVLAADADGHAHTFSAPFETREGDSPAQVTVTMKRLTRLVAHVINERREPVADADVTASLDVPEVELPSDPPLTEEQQRVRSYQSVVSSYAGHGKRPPRTDADGVLELWLAPGRYHVFAFKRPMMSDGLKVMLRGDEPASIDIVVSPRIAITGSVTDASGALVSGVVVSAQAIEGPTCASSGLDTSSAFRLTGLVPGRYRVRVSNAAGESDAVEVTAPADAVVLRWDPPMVKRVSVLVLDDVTGKPAVGASVLVASQGGAVVSHATSDVDGLCDLPLGIGHHDVFAGLRGRAVAVLPIDIGADQAEPIAATVRLGAAQSVRGRVVDLGGRGVAGALVTVVAARWFPLRSTAVVTDVDGAFQLDSLPAGGARIGVISCKEVADGVSDVAAGAENVVLTIQR